MIQQLRMYTVKAGEMEEWLEEWKTVVCPLRAKFGFRIVGAWVVLEENRFIWIVGHDDDFEAKNAEYYASAERTSVDPNPARHLSQSQTTLMTVTA